jgi:CBS domain containing-hemolysin-like protein
MLRGDYPLEDLKELSPLGDEVPEVNSVGGLIVTLLDRMPQVGDRVSFAGIELQVETVSGRAVRTARVRLPTASQEDPGA